jgi:hypothetical protein
MTPDPQAPPARIFKTVDPAIADLVPRYLSRCRSNLVRLGHLHHDEQFEAIVALGWDFAGSGRAFGFDRVSTLGERLARAAEQEDGPAILHSMHALERYLDALTLVLPSPGPAPSPNTENSI